LELALENNFIALSGSISSKKLSHLYRDIIEEVKGTGVKVSVDCGGEALFEAAKAKPYAIKPNLSEFNEAFGFNSKTIDDIKNAALRVCENGIENILISLDKSGALCVLKGKAYFVYNLDLPVYNTVGAGDAFLSGFLYAKHKEKDDISSLKYAESFAQAAVSHKADFEKSLNEYEKYVSQIKVEELV
jgi:1-phosphofructokinase